ncbi:hypothetical protein ILUMI_06463 [Ignelater luminosus]|uniref:Peptidase S1 domain-containing protein n=1 Tax=Ignelater luminosus TaxID=2038154 RepID=A0A8K0D965_IGNLU|nr:hypothetical protein ILUMI_06463 [Ignelater luminosus]
MASRHIVNNVAMKGQFPYFAQIFYMDRGNKLFQEIEICTASIIHSQWVLTAAHCLQPIEVSFETLRVSVVFAGSVKVHDTYAQKQVIKGYIVHPLFKFARNPKTGLINMENDVAIAELQRKFKLNSDVKPVKLPSINLLKKEVLPKCHMGWIIGMGFNNGFQKEEVSFVRFQNVFVQTTKDITKYVHIFPTKNVFFSSTLSKNFVGNAGGPFVCKYRNGTHVQYGVISHILNNTVQHQIVTLYESVQFHLDFIVDNVPSTKKPRTFQPNVMAARASTRSNNKTDVIFYVKFYIFILLCLINSESI